MIVVPHRFAAGIGGAFALYTVLFAIAHTVETGTWLTNGLALALFVLGAVVCIAGLGGERLALSRAIAGTGAAVLLPLLGSVGIDPGGSFTSGAWYVPGVTCLVVLLLWRRRAGFAWAALGALMLHTFAWAGLRGLNAFGVVAALLVIALLAGGGWALARAERALQASTATEVEAIAWRAAQDAFHAERQVRLATTADLAGDMLRRIVASGGRLDVGERVECRVLEQTIRDEIRGRHLLNDAVRSQVIAHRRRGAFVQVHDDGGLDDLDPARLDTLLDRVAASLDGLRSDTIVLRTAPADSATAITVVATTSDPVLSALGMDDDPEVDLWLELERPDAPVA